MSRMSKKKSRREFLSEVSGAAAAAAGSGAFGSLVTGCGGEGPLNPDTPQDSLPNETFEPVTAVIGGPDELHIPSLGGTVSGTFDSGSSVGATPIC